MSTRSVPVHYLRGNAAERVPRRLVVFDTESRSTFSGDHEYHTLRLWCLRRFHRKRQGDPWIEDLAQAGKSREGLANVIEGFARTTAATWVYAHNLSFDLTISGLIDVLTGRGWKITQHALTSEQPWLRLARGKKRLTIADSGSLFRCSVEELGRSLGMGKPQLPTDDDGYLTWLARCMADVAIVVKGLQQAMAWWYANNLGNWTVTGPGLGWNAYRHLWPPASVVIDPEPAARALERTAIAGGFRWQGVHGEMVRRPVADVDLVHAHLSVAQGYPLPRRRLAHFTSLRTDDPMLCTERQGTLARALVRVGEPRYPCRIGGELWYPTGMFWTVLAGPELVDAQGRGALVRIGEGYRYLLDRTMLGWANWVAGMLDCPELAPPPAAYRMVKAWSRSVPGRWAVRASELWDSTPTPLGGTEITLGRLHPSGERLATVQAGGKVDRYILDVEGDNSFPAVLAWIQAWTRVHLLRLLETYGGCFLAANTDGAILDLEAVRRLEWDTWGPDLENGQPYGEIAGSLPENLSAFTLPLTVALKRQSPWIKVLGPAHVVMEDERRLSGIPRRAVETEPGVFGFETWPGLRTQYARGAPDAYVQGARRVNLNHMAPQGWLLTNGTVTPLVVYTGSEGELTGHVPDDYGPESRGLAPLECQHPMLQRLVNEARAAGRRIAPLPTH